MYVRDNSWAFGVEKKDTYDDFVAIYDFLMANPDFQKYNECYEAMNVLCDMAYEKGNEELVVSPGRA